MFIYFHFYYVPPPAPQMTEEKCVFQKEKSTFWLINIFAFVNAYLGFQCIFVLYMYAISWIAAQRKKKMNIVHFCNKFHFWCTPQNIFVVLSIQLLLLPGFLLFFSFCSYNMRKIDVFRIASLSLHVSHLG